MDTGGGMNTIDLGGVTHLLTGGNSLAVHLTRESRPGEPGRGAVPGHYLRSPQRKSALLKGGYDLSLLRAPRWAEKTLCGYRWIAMVSSSSEPVGMFGQVEALTPTCRRCLSLIDRLFPEPRLDERLPLVTQLIADLVIERGCAEICGVPGDQQAALRKHVRAAVRRRTGHGTRTYAHGSVVAFECEPIWEQHKIENLQAAAEAMTRVITGEPGQAEASSRRLLWDAWDAG